MLALEQAMDELALRLDMDPVELRIRNEPKQDPEKNVPFSTRALVPCLQEGARRFGWDKRNPRPRSARDGHWLLGMGMAAASRGNILRPAEARVTMASAQNAVVEMDMTDIGTGSYTVFAQIAAELLDLPVGQHRGAPGPQLLSRHAGLGRLVRRLELRGRAARRLHQAQGQARRRRRRPGPVGHRPGETGRRRQEILAERLWRAFRRGRRRRRPPARSGCAACWACSPPAGS